MRMHQPCWLLAAHLRMGYLHSSQASGNRGLASHAAGNCVAGDIDSMEGNPCANREPTPRRAGLRCLQTRAAHGFQRDGPIRGRATERRGSGMTQILADKISINDGE